MTVKIEIEASNGTEAAAELKRLADGLAIMGLVQQHAMQQRSSVAAPAAVHVPGSAEQKAHNQMLAEENSQRKAEAAAQQVSSDAVAKTDEPAKEAATTEQPAAEKAEKPKRGRKSKAAKEAEAVAAQPQSSDTVDHGTADGAPDENPNPYRLFDENGAEEELFDTANAYKTALINMLKDAPDEMTCTSVGKANEETVKRLQEEGVELKSIIDAYQGRLSALKAKNKGAEATAPAAEPAPATPATTEGEPIMIEAVKAAIVSLSSAKGVPVAIATLKQFGASKAGEVKEADRAAFIKACAEAAA